MHVKTLRARCPECGRTDKASARGGLIRSHYRSRKHLVAVGKVRGPRNLDGSVRAVQRPKVPGKRRKKWNPERERARKAFREANGLCTRCGDPVEAPAVGTDGKPKRRMKTCRGCRETACAKYGAKTEKAA